MGHVLGDQGLRFGLLGPLAGWRDGHPLALGSPQQQAVLALLIVRRGAFLSADTVVDALWAEEAPTNALQTVRTYVSRLRKLLADADSSPLTSGPTGYRLADDAAEVDVEQFEALLRSGRSALSEGDAAGAETLLSSKFLIEELYPIEFPGYH